MSPVPIEKLQAVPVHSGGDLLRIPSGQLVCLTNGRYSVRLRARGSGYSQWGNLAVTRWSADEICDVDGFHVYLRDLDDNFVWSAGYQPTRVAAAQYDFRAVGQVAEIVRLDRDIDCRLTVCVAPRHDCELRHCRLTNYSGRTRRIEFTSYLEWVLAPREGDANHPAFSKLFIETQFSPERTAIFARRRPRGSDDPHVWGLHFLLRDDSQELQHPVQFETSRAAFIGRGRTLRRPRALDRCAILAGEVGPVLDPIGSLRAAMSLDPGESRDVAFLLGIAASRDELDDMLVSFGDLSDVDATLREVGTGANSSNGQQRQSQGENPASPADHLIVHSPHRTPRATSIRPRVDRETASVSTSTDRKAHV